MNKIRLKLTAFFAALKSYFAECAAAYKSYAAADASMKAFVDQARARAIILESSPVPMHEYSFEAFAILRKLYDLSVLDEDWNIQIGELLKKSELEAVNHSELLIRDAAPELFAALNRSDEALNGKLASMTQTQIERMLLANSYALKKAQGLA